MRYPSKTHPSHTYVHKYPPSVAFSLRPCSAFRLCTCCVIAWRSSLSPKHRSLSDFYVAQGHDDVVRLLVSELGASLEVCDGEGDRPLAWAAYKGQLATVR